MGGMYSLSHDSVVEHHSELLFQYAVSSCSAGYQLPGSTDLTRFHEVRRKPDSIEGQTAPDGPSDYQVICARNYMPFVN